MKPLPSIIMLVVCQILYRAVLYRKKMLFGNSILWDKRIRTQYIKLSPEKWEFESLLSHQDSCLLAEICLEQTPLLLAPLWPLDLALGHISKGRGALLTESCAAHGSVTGLKEHRWLWKLTWFSQFLWLVFSHDISLAPKRPKHWPSLYGMFIYMEACIQVTESTHLFAKNWNEHQKSMICHCGIPRRLTGCNLS